ncbi:hypothetical protein V6N11_001038 [Hibiscus sabdariffa]|uniref:FLZ-type domain-containing protein n=1 Tax=Hibiscus sabdariffa TaxID=183260 RepID=A0ABR2RYX5_9ROSI
MDSSGRSRRHRFGKEKQGLAYLAVEETGHSGNHYQNEFSQRPLCGPRVISSSSPSCSSPSSATCFLCKKPLGGNEEIFVYRRDFCSKECRQEQLDIDESKDNSKSLPSSIKASSIGDVNSSIRIERYASNMLPKEILERPSLQKLYLVDCIALKIFPLPCSLKTLYVHNCRALEFPQYYEPMNQLKNVTLWNSCDFLQTFPLNYFPKLKYLCLRDCRNLENVSIDNELQNELPSFKFLEISDCPKLSFFVEDEFQAPNLKTVGFFDCASLKSVQSILAFESLRFLHLVECPALESFTKEGLPSGLISLSISFCDKMTPHKGWKLDKLHSLCDFHIEGGCEELESFPEEGLLPTNLANLISDHPRRETVADVFGGVGGLVITLNLCPPLKIFLNPSPEANDT